jgi:hypothetical protein
MTGEVARRLANGIREGVMVCGPLYNKSEDKFSQSVISCKRILEFRKSRLTEAASIIVQEG